MTSKNPQIRIAAQEVTRQFANGSGVFAADLKVHAGEIVALIGLNGAGKTTLMKLLLGMLKPDSGNVEINGRNISSMPAADWKVVGHVIEYPLAYPELTVRQNLQLVSRLRDSNDPHGTDVIIKELSLGMYADRGVRSLSLGNRQRVGLASALMHHPEVVVLDEPTNSLDPAGVIALRDALHRCVARGAGVLVSSHHLDEVSRLANRILVMNGGRIIGQLPPGEANLEHAFFELVRQDDEERNKS